MDALASGSSALLALAYLAITIAPGLLAASLAGLRGWQLLAISPLLGYGIIGGAGSLLPLLGVRWSPMTYAGGAIVVSLVLGVVLILSKRCSPKPDEEPAGFAFWTAAQNVGIAVSVAIAAVTGYVATSLATRDFTAIPQVWDSVFHSNATYFIATTGESSPSALQELNQPDIQNYYYPNGYHVMAATFVMLTNTAVSTSLELSFAIVPLYMALGFVALIRNLRMRPALAASVAAISGSFTAFPYDLLPWGTLLPFLTAVALLPAFLSLWVLLIHENVHRPIILSAVLGFSAVGIIALHPSVAIAAAMMGLGFLVQTWLRRGARLSDAIAVAVTSIAALVLGAPLILASASAAGGAAYDWPATLLPADAAGQVMLQSHGQSFPQWWLAILTLLGFLSLRRHLSLIWIAVVGVAFSALFVLAASYEGSVVELLTKPWWNDKWRLAALWTLCAIPVAGAGIVLVKDFLWNAMQRMLPFVRDFRMLRTQVSSAATLAVLILLIALSSEGFYLGRNTARLGQAFTDGPTVSRLELEAFEVLARAVPPGGMVMNDPYDGSALMWSLTGVRPAFASPVIANHELSTMEKNRRILFDSFNQIDTNPKVQEAVKNLGIDFVIVCQGFIAPASEHVAGMRDLGLVDRLEVVYQNEEATIYRIRASGSELRE